MKSFTRLLPPLSDSTTMASKRLAIVLGAGPGTGQAIAKALARNGDTVALLSRSEATLNQVAEAVKAEGGDVSIAALLYSITLSFTN